MSPEEAQTIFGEFEEVVINNWLQQRDKLGPNLRCVSRRGLRKAILICVADAKFEGLDILRRYKLKDGNRVAPLELADKMWRRVYFWGAVEEGHLALESNGENDAPEQLHDEFVEFILMLDREDPKYWEKVEAKVDSVACSELEAESL